MASKGKQSKPESLGSQQLMKVRSDLRAGVQGECALGIQYWRKEYNYWKKIAQNLGCI